MGTTRLCSCNRKNRICENKSFRKKLRFVKKHYWHFFHDEPGCWYERRDCAPVIEKLQFAKLNDSEKFIFCKIRSEISCWWERHDCAPAMEKSAICENKSFRKKSRLWRNIIDISFTTNLVTSMYERRDCAPVMEKLQFVKFCILTVRLELWFLFCFVILFSGLTKWSSLELQSPPLSSEAAPPHSPTPKE